MAHPQQLPRKALIAITSYNGPFWSDGTKTGLFYTEALHPFEALVAAGFEVDLASETGTYGLDEHSIKPPLLGEADAHALHDAAHPFNAKLRGQLKRAADVDPSQYGLFFASAGHGTLYDYPTAHGLIGIAADVYRRGGVVAAVCHGPAILPAVVDAATGGSIIDGKTVTGFTTLAEGALGVLERIRADGLQTIEEGAERVGARYVAPQKPFEAFSLVDGRVVTGANPASAHLTAENAIAVFDALSSC